MSALAAVLASVSATFDEIGATWALVGGLAVSCHVDPRFTRDVDVAVAVDDDAGAEAIVHAFVTRGYVLRAALEQRAVGRLATVRLVAPGPGAEIFVDLLLASSGIETEICARAMQTEALPGVLVPVARRADLIAMKVLSKSATRLQDTLDLRALLDGATDDDAADARAALRMITDRGFNRQRDLDAVLSSCL